jgi:glycosyltransferase involved in cell wall biosynthesis
MEKDSGASVRIYHLVRGLFSQGNSVNVIMPGKENMCTDVDGVKVYFIRGFLPIRVLEILRRLIGVARPTSLYFYDFLFILRLRRRIQEADIVQIEGPAGGVLALLIRRFLRKIVVVDCHDVFQALRLEHTSTLRKMLATSLEKLSYGSADLVLTVSKKEKDYLASYKIKENRVEVVPNGVDTTLFVRYDSSNIRARYALGRHRTVIFVGNMEYWPNREAVQAIAYEIAPRVRKEITDARFLVVGRTPREMALPGLIFTGVVENVAEFLAASDVAIAPLFHGSGTRLKILEYFSCGLPVVSTSVGAEGLDVADGMNIIVEDNMDEFSAKIVELLNDHESSLKLGKRARELVVEKHDWKRIAAKLNEAYFNLLSRKKWEARRLPFL